MTDSGTFGLLLYGIHGILALLCGAWIVHRGRADGRMALLLLVFVAGTATFALSEPLRRPFEDFADAYYAGGRAALDGVGSVRGLYASGVSGFVNIPIVAFIFAPLALLPEATAAVLFLGLGLAATALAWLIVVRTSDLDTRGQAILAVLFALNGPLSNSLKEGNTSHFALLALATAWSALRQQREWLAGFALGLAAIFKLPLLLFGVYALIRGRIRTVIAGGGVILIAALTSLMVFGFDTNLAWYQQVVAGTGERPIGGFNVQSSHAALLRLGFGGAVVCSWDGSWMPTYGRILATAASLAMVALPLLASAWTRRCDRDGCRVRLDLEFMTVTMLACVASPLAWSHYYTWALLPLAVLLARIHTLDRTDTCVFILSTVLLMLPVVWPWCNPSGPFALPYLVFTSHYFLGGALLILLLVKKNIEHHRDNERRVGARTD